MKFSFDLPYVPRIKQPIRDVLSDVNPVNKMAPFVECCIQEFMKILNGTSLYNAMYHSTTVQLSRD